MQVFIEGMPAAVEIGAARWQYKQSMRNWPAWRACEKASGWRSWTEKSALPMEYNVPTETARRPLKPRTAAARTRRLLTLAHDIADHLLDGTAVPYDFARAEKLS
jgi:hypothetical protein